MTRHACLLIVLVERRVCARGDFEHGST
jgi:hypothetical protein